MEKDDTWQLIREDADFSQGAQFLAQNNQKILLFSPTFNLLFYPHLILLFFTTLKLLVN